MRAKACTTCRQWKARCDAKAGVPGGCSRCRSLKQPCVFDASFKRTSKAKCIQQMSTEIQQLRQALFEVQSTNPTSSPSNQPISDGSSFSTEQRQSEMVDSGNPAADKTSSDNGMQQSSPVSVRESPQDTLQLQQTLLTPTQSGGTPNPIAASGGTAFPTDWQRPLFSSSHDTPELPETSVTVPPRGSIERRLTPAGTPYRILGDVGLTQGQVEELFRAYFAHFHQYLPFKMDSTSPEDICAKCPLLFWVIITVASTRKLRTRLAPMIKAMVGDSMYVRVRSVETVQALLILCIWPFSCSSLNEDPSHIYSGIAAQMGLQLGLHCHTQAHSHLSLVHHLMNRDDEVKLTTWLACYVVNQMHSNILGVPPSIMVDYSLLGHFSHPSLDPNLSKMCRIYHLLTQSTLDLSGYGPNSPSPTTSSPLEPASRVKVILTYGAEFSALQAQHLEDMNDAIKILFLSSRLQVWSFALTEDTPISPEQTEIVKQAEKDACDLIELCYNLNLSVAPCYIRRAMCYCAFVLAKVLRSQQATQCEVLEDNIEKVRQALMTTSDSKGDITHKACELLQDLPYMEDKRLSPPIVSRMGVSVLYDLLRIGVENTIEKQMGQRTMTNFTFDLDGFNWALLGLS
ncbi:hypothetical protein ABW19_dt0200919 [Dactylella cylindrospora]|nr:hypothetical protein ABW19_dt0200919 [Dactylella cylindrospora]